jgi:adenylate kinase
MLNIVLFGPPGSGKGTQSEKLIKKYKLVHLSTGDLLRNEIANKTELGMKAKSIMDKGELVSDEIVIGMIRNKITSNKNARGFIFDGFPRTDKQAVALDELLSESEIPINLMITLEVDKEELIKRLLKRGEETGRADDNLQTIENRINVYIRQTSPVIDFYKKQGKYHPVHGIGSIEEIFSRIVREIQSLKDYSYIPVSIQ